MIQRIQTIYLLLVSILMTLVLALPIAKFSHSGYVVSVEVYNMIGRNLTQGGSQLFKFDHLALAITVAITIALVTIFFFRNRKMQIKLCITEIVVLAITQCMIFWMFWTINSNPDFEFVNTFSNYVVCALPAICIIITLLALRSIRKDEKLVRSLDRIR